VHEAPFALRPHELLAQVLGDTQSLSLLHEDRQPPLLQRKVPHDVSAGVTHVPRPSQVDAGVCDVVFAQTAALQTVRLST